MLCCVLDCGLKLSYGIMVLGPRDEGGEWKKAVQPRGKGGEALANKDKKTKQEQPKRKTGRPSKFTDETIPSLQKAVKLVDDGLTDDAIAEYLGIQRSSVANWKEENAEFLDAIKKLKETRNSQVERSLFQRACGYELTERKPMIVNGKTEIVEVKKEFPPDTAAAFIWLKNRDPKRWRDKHELEHSGGMQIVYAPPEAEKV